jgi:hypothetical protein
MRLEGTLDFEHRRVQRWVPFVAIVIPVFLFVTGAAWFIRAFIAPPMAAIPSPSAIAAAAPPSERPSPEPSQASARDEKPAVMAYAGRTEPASPPPLPMPVFASFAIAPPMASLRTAPPATAEPEPPITALPAPENQPPDGASDAAAAPPPDIVASLPQERNTDATVAAIPESGTPIAGPIPLPPQRPRLAATSADGHVPLPRTPPQQAEAKPAAADAERRSFAAHGAE